MKTNKLILIGLLFTTVIVNAQTDFRPGYIIKTPGDTLFGKIDYRGDLKMSFVCKFKDKENTIREYSPDDITAFRFTDSKYFVSKKVNEKTMFLEYLIKGKVNIYFGRDENGDHYYIDKDDVTLTEIPYEEGVKYVNNEPKYYESKKHIGVLNYFMQDASGFQSRIETIKKPERQNLIKLAKDYHNAVCEGENCTIYEKSVPFIKISPEVIGGVINYSTVDDLNDKIYFHAGIIGHIWMPSSSEKMYFRTGIIFSQLDINDEIKNFYKIPCQLEYIYPKGFFRPRFAYGLNFYKQNYRSVSFNLGGNLKISKSLFLSAASDIEFNPTLLIVPKSLFSYSFQFGLFISL